MRTLSRFPLHVDVGFELEAVRRAFNARMARQQSEIRAASARLEKRIGLRDDPQGGWISRLAPLTVLYPLLQFQGISGVDPCAARKATLSHFFLLIHAFIDDRRIDGQIRLDVWEHRMTRMCLHEGIRLLEELPGFDCKARSAVDSVMATYSSISNHSYGSYDGAVQKFSHRRILRIASGRATYGGLATTVLALTASMPSRFIRRVTNAYAILVTALQWSDDLSDWREDLERGEDNLLLYLANLNGMEWRRRRYEPWAGAIVAESLLRLRIFDAAEDQARRWFAAAAMRQRLLGTHALAGLIEDVPARLAAARVRAVGKAAREVWLHAAFHPKMHTLQRTDSC